MESRKVCQICKSCEFKLKFVFPGYNVIECKKCNLRARNVVFDKSELKVLYSKDYFCDLQKDFFINNQEVRIQTFQKKLEILEHLYPQKGKLLDIGCAMGLFLKIAKKNQWDTSGIELSEYAANYALQEQLNVYNSDLLELNLPSNSFDVISMWDMIDHSENPDMFLKEVYRILKPGGLVAMDTFMEDAFLFYLANLVYKCAFGFIKYPAQKAHPIHHSHYFTQKTFKNLLTSNHFEIILSKGGYLEGEIVSLGRIGKKIVTSFNLISKIIGKEMELLLIGRKIV